MNEQKLIKDCTDIELAEQLIIEYERFLQCKAIIGGIQQIIAERKTKSQPVIDKD